ncbi:MAG: TPM domain-containing protein [Deltaproteobacteria bacterium]
MKHTLNDEERSRLNQSIADAEARTGVQIVLTVVERSDVYAELPWKAFALGASCAGLLVLIMNAIWPLTSPTQAMFLAMIMMLVPAAGFALLTVFVPDFARLFLPAHRAEAETRQYAESLFLSRQLFAAPERKAVLLLVSLFERRVVVLPDTGLVRKLNQGATAKVIQSMRPHLVAGRTAQALEAGLQKMEEMIVQPEVSHELPNIIEEKGA